MKNKINLLLLAFVLVSLIGYSQKTVNAKDIIKDIKAGKDINISNVTIVGNLDFTYMEDKLDNLPKRKKRWWNKGGDNMIKNLIKVNISFTNCTFKDDVLAYIPDSHDSGYTFVANFDKNVTFEGSVFERKALFKYSSFEESSSFENVKFLDDSTFKYAKFRSNTSFSNTVFENEATFKHATFKKYASFANATFNENASFKYTKFLDGVSFKKVRFQEDLDIKYAQITGKFDISGMNVQYDIDSKYTRVNGRSFSKFLLEN